MLTLATNAMLCVLALLRAFAHLSAISLSPYFTHVINFSRFPPIPACNIGKFRGAWGRGYLLCNDMVFEIECVHVLAGASIFEEIKDNLKLLDRAESVQMLVSSVYVYIYLILLVFHFNL